jgi:hypothetical protein
MNQVGLWLVNSTTFTAQAEVDLTNIFTNDYENYKVLSRIFSSTGTPQRVRYLSGTNTPFTLNEYVSFGYERNTAGTVTNLGATRDFWYTTDLSNSSNLAAPCEFTFMSPNTNRLKWAVLQNYAPVNLNMNHQQMRCTNATQFTGLKFYAAGGFTLTGTISVYGYNS